MTYKFSNMDISLYAGYRLIDSDNLDLYLFAGPAYVNFVQKYTVDTVGENAAFGNDTTSRTFERLDDHLLGGKLGFKGRISFLEKFSASLCQGFGFYTRGSWLHGEQEMQNAAGVGGGLAMFLSLNDRIEITDRDVGFVPQLDTDVALAYDITDWMSLSTYYQFKAWFNLSRIKNPMVTADLLQIESEPTRIEHENIYSHTIGAKIAIKF